MKNLLTFFNSWKCFYPIYIGWLWFSGAVIYVWGDWNLAQELIPRAGAVLVCVSIWCEAIFIRGMSLGDLEWEKGMHEVQKNYGKWSEESQQVRDAVEADIDEHRVNFVEVRFEAERVARFWIVLTAIAGTVAWAYGDLILAKILTYSESLTAIG